MPALSAPVMSLTVVLSGIWLSIWASSSISVILDIFLYTMVLQRRACSASAQNLVERVGADKKTIFRFYIFPCTRYSLDTPVFTETRSIHSPNSPYPVSKASSDHFVPAFQEKPMAFLHSSLTVRITMDRVSFVESLFHCYAQCAGPQEATVYEIGSIIRDRLHVKESYHTVQRVLEVDWESQT